MPKSTHTEPSGGESVSEMTRTVVIVDDEFDVRDAVAALF
jgi:hypothetical protein